MIIELEWRQNYDEHDNSFDTMVSACICRNFFLLQRPLILENPKGNVVYYRVSYQPFVHRLLMKGLKLIHLVLYITLYSLAVITSHLCIIMVFLFSIVSCEVFRVCYLL